MSVSSYCIPLNWQLLNNGDIDLGSAGLLLISGTQLAISGGKQSVLYRVERDNMGGITNAIQSWSLNGGEIHGGPVWWTAPKGSFMYVWPDSSGHLLQYQFTNGSFNLTPYAQGTTIGGSGSPGPILAVSSDRHRLLSNHLSVTNALSRVASGILPDLEGGVSPPGSHVAPFQQGERSSCQTIILPGKMPGSTARETPAATPNE